MITENRFEQLYDRHVGDVAAFLYSYASDKDQLKDWIQGVFIKLWEKRGQINFEHRSFKSYLLTTARNHALTKLRQENKYDHWLEENLEKLTQNQYQDELVVKTPDTSKVYQQALSQISPRACKAYLLSREEGLTYPEIAETMDISVKTVEAHISHALQILREELKDQLRTK